MNFKLNFALLLTILSSLSISLKLPAHAEMNFQDMKGVHNLVSPEYEYLSPIYGFTLLGTRTLENMRFYGNYGPKLEGLGCLEKASHIHNILMSNNDCPGDKTSELLQRLFPSQDGAIFVSNQIDSDIFSHLEPKTLGIIIKSLSTISDSNLQDPKKIPELKAALKTEIFLEMNPQSYYDNIRKMATARLKEIKNQARRKKPQTSQCSGECQKTEIDQLEKQIVLAQEALKSLTASSAKKGKGKEIDFTEMANLLIDALVESRPPTQLYPKHLTEQILLSYFWKRANTKQDFLPLLNGMKMTPDSERLNPFLTEKYSKSDYDANRLENEPKEALARELLLNPEKLVFLAEQDKLIFKSLPPILSYSQAKHSSLGNSRYSDCGETSLRNFLNILLYDPIAGKFSAEKLTQLQKLNPSLQIHPNLISFYEKHPDPAAAVKQEVRNEWSEAITSRHPGVIYNKPPSAPQCEISSSEGGIDNMFVVLERLFYRRMPDPEKDDSEEIHKDTHPTQEKSQKLTELCRDLSREGFRLDWKLSGTQDHSRDHSRLDQMKFADIEFSINEKPSFVWVFRQGHFAIISLQKDPDNWKSKIAQELSRQIGAEPSAGNHRLPHSSLLINWFSSEKNWDQLLNNESHPMPPAVQTNLLYSLPLGFDEVKLSAYEKILKNQFAPLYSSAKRLQAKLPTDDIETQSRINAALADANYPQPWTEPTHAIGKPEIIYTRVSSEPDLMNKLVTEHGNIFENAWKGPSGLIWLESLKAKEDPMTDKRMKWEAAKKYCVNLNPKNIRKTVANFLDSLETNQELQKLRLSYYERKSEKRKIALLKKYAELKKAQVAGCFLPPIEEFLILREDFGFNERNNQYIPQFLPKLYGKDGSGNTRWFWSGSSYPYDIDEALSFSGINGQVDFDSSSFVTLSVRCACVGTTK